MIENPCYSTSKEMHLMTQQVQLKVPAATNWNLLELLRQVIFSLETILTYVMDMFYLENSSVGFRLYIVVHFVNKFILIGSLHLETSF